MCRKTSFHTHFLQVVQKGASNQCCQPYALIDLHSAAPLPQTLTHRSVFLRHAEDFVTAEQLGQLLRVVPEKDRHVIELQWSVPSEVAAYRQAPCAYLSHLLGCDNRGSRVVGQMGRCSRAVECIALHGNGRQQNSLMLFPIIVDLLAEVVLKAEGHRWISHIVTRDRWREIM